MEPRDFLTLAEKLVVAKNAGAAHFRTATGRAYYAAFHQVSNVLGELGFPPAESAEGHVQAVRLLQRSGDTKLEPASSGTFTYSDEKQTTSCKDPMSRK